MSKIEIEDRIAERDETQRIALYHQSRQQESDSTNQESMIMNRYVDD